MTRVGPFTVDNDCEFTLGDLRKIGPWQNDAGEWVFVDYSGTGKAWFDYALTDVVFDKTKNHYVNVPAATISPGAYAEQKTRRRVLKAMVTRRDNKRRTSDLK